MSFSREVKEELSKINNLANKEEVKYEFLGYLLSENIIQEKEKIKFSTENDYNINRFAKIIRNIGIEDFEINVNGKIFYIEFLKINKKLDVLELIKQADSINQEKFNSINLIRAFMRGLFLGSGSINNPENKYHLECKISKKENISKIIDIMKKNDIYLKQLQNTIYLKEGEEISKFLAFIGATKSMLKFEEIRVKRYMNNKVNRLVNCKTANLNKVINASVEQVDAIRTLKQNKQFEKLDNTLKEIANLRLQNPDMSLIELGQKLTKPLGKSGVNYRLKKIIKLAQEGKNI